MAHFYGEISSRSPRGGRIGIASRMGTKQDGMRAHIRGWGIGAEVEVSHEQGRDVVRVYRTSGSGGSGSRILVAEFSEERQS